MDRFYILLVGMKSQKISSKLNKYF